MNWEPGHIFVHILNSQPFSQHFKRFLQDMEMFSTCSTKRPIMPKQGEGVDCKYLPWSLAYYFPYVEIWDVRQVTYQKYCNISLLKRISKA